MRLVVQRERLRAEAHDVLRAGLLERRLEQVHGRAADEGGHEDVERPVVEHLRVVDLLQLALLHHGDAVAHRQRLDLVVGHVERRDAQVVLQLRDLGARLDAQLGVEVRERLVHQERLRMAHDRAAHRDALALAARQVARLSLEQLLEVEDARGVLDARVDLGLRHLLDAQAERDVLVDGEVRVERVALEDHRDVAVARGHVIDDSLADLDDALADVLEPRQHAQRRRLATSGRPDEHHELAVLDVEVEVVHRARTVGVHLRHAIERHRGQRINLSSSPPAPSRTRPFSPTRPLAETTIPPRGVLC